MSSKEIITVELIRKVNERMIAQGSKNDGKRSVYSAFLNRDIANNTPSDAKSLNAVWAKVSAPTNA